MEKAETSKGASMWGVDSDFVKAFEEAMSKYKKMHEKFTTGRGSVEAEGSSSSSTVKNATHGADESGSEVARMSRENPSKTETPKENPSKTKTVKTENPPLPVTEPRVDSQPAQEGQGTVNSYERENRLLREYLELRDRMIKIKEELNKDHWNVRRSGDPPQHFPNGDNSGEHDHYYDNGGFDYQYSGEAARHYANEGLNNQYPGEAPWDYAYVGLNNQYPGEGAARHYANEGLNNQYSGEAPWDYAYVGLNNQNPGEGAARYYANEGLNNQYPGEAPWHYAYGGLNNQYPGEGAARHYANEGSNHQYPGEAAQHYVTPPYRVYYPATMWAFSGYYHPRPALQLDQCRGCCSCLYPHVPEEPSASSSDDDNESDFTAGQKTMSFEKIDADGSTSGDEETDDEQEEVTVTKYAPEFSTVLNSWYAADHHAEKYLAEHSHLK